jgi:hypothetical protein
VLWRLLEKLGFRSSQLSQDELAEEEAIRRQAEAERLQAEARMAEQRARIDAGNSGGTPFP